MSKGNPNNYKGKVTLQRVRLDRQGYDDRGCYYGVGAPLYYWCRESNHEPLDPYGRQGYIRARNRQNAKAKVRSLPLMCECRFY